MNETKQLSEFVTRLKYDMLTKEIVEIAKNAFLDCFGVTLAGLNTIVGEKIVKYVKEIGGNPRATVLGTKFRTSVQNAALANGVMAHALDYDDITPNMAGHPSCTIVPILLALGEDLRISGKDLITAYVAGFEIETRINLGVMDEHYKKGWHNTATIGTIGAAATAAKLLKLDTENIQVAFGISFSMLAGLKRNFGTMTKPLHVGNAAQNGLAAASLAKEGFTAQKNLLEDHGGFCEVYCGEGKYNLERIVTNLNSLDSYTIINPGIGFKKYPSCYGTHQALDAMFSLMKENNIVPEQIEEVKCETSESSYSCVDYEDPKTGLEGKFSFQYCLARVLLDRKLGIAEFTNEKVREANVQKIMKKVKVYIHPELKGKAVKDVGFGFTIVTVTQKDGGIFSKKVITPRGETTNPISKVELIYKFKECANFVLPREKDINHAVELLINLEKLNDIKELIEIVAKR